MVKVIAQKGRRIRSAAGHCHQILSYFCIRRPAKSAVKRADLCAPMWIVHWRMSMEGAARSTCIWLSTRRIGARRRASFSSSCYISCHRITQSLGLQFKSIPLHRKTPRRSSFASQFEFKVKQNIETSHSPCFTWEIGNLFVKSIQLFKDSLFGWNPYSTFCHRLQSLVEDSVGVEGRNSKQVRRTSAGCKYAWTFH